MQLRIVLLLLALFAFAPSADARLGAEGFGATQVTITGITCSLCTSNTTANPGDQVGTLAATATGGALLSPVFALVSAGGSGMIVSANTLQIGPSGPPAAASYSVQVSVTGSNASNAPPPQTYTVTAVVSSNLTITGISASGCSVNAGAAQGTAICTMTPTYAGGSPSSQNVICGSSGNGCISSEFQVGGTNPFILQVGSAGVTAGSPTPTFTVSAVGATNSPQTYTVPVTVSAAPVTITGITTSPSPCAGTVGDAQGHANCTLTAVGTGGSLGTVSYSITCGVGCNNNGGRFQISGTGLQAGATPYSPGTYSNSIQVTSSTATNSPFVVTGVQAQIASSGGTSLVQKRVVTNFGASASPSNAWLDVGQPFAQGQIPAGDGVLWQTGSLVPITSQADDCTYWPDGSVKFCSFTLQFPTALSHLQQDTAVGAYDSPGGAPGHTCFSGSPTTLVTNHDFRVEVTLSAAQVTGSIAGTTLTVASVQSGALAIGQSIWSPKLTTAQTITGGSGSTWTVSPGATLSGTNQIAAGRGTTYTMSANNEFANEASTHTIMYRSGAILCSYEIRGQLRNGTTFGSTAQGQLWAQIYADFRADGTYRIQGRAYQCQPLINSTTQITSCNWVGLAPDANGDMFAIKDYSLGGDPILMGCAYLAVSTSSVPACVPSGHATGAGTTIYYGQAFDTMSFDGWPYDSQPDAHMVLTAFPSLLSSDPTTRGWYDAMLAPNLGYTTASLADIVSSNYAEGGYGPNICANFQGVGCDFGGTGESGFIGLNSMDMSQCLLAGGVATSSAGWRVCNNSRMEALTMDAVQMAFRDQLTGRQVNLSQFYTPAAGTMNTYTNGGWGLLPGANQITANAIQFLNHAQTTNHNPNFGEMQCILTGQRPFCDMMRDQANLDVGSQNQGFRNPTTLNGPNGHAYSGIIQQVPQVRAMAWMDRDVANAYWLTPDFLVDGVTANPEKAYFAALHTGIHGTLAYFNDLATGPYMTTAQQTLGIIAPLGPNGNGGGTLIEAIMWQAGYMANQQLLEAARGSFNTTNCRNSFTTATASCNIFINWIDKFYLGAGINGCMATAAPAYALSSTIASRPYALNNTGIVAQAWSDVYTGDVESNTLSLPGQASQPPGQTTGGLSFELTFTSTPVPLPTVGMNLNFGTKASLTQSGITIPAETVVTSVAQDVSGTCVTGKCYIIGFGPNPMTGGTIPSSIGTGFQFITWGADGTFPPPSVPEPLIPAAGCPTQGLSNNTHLNLPSAINAHVQYFYAAAVAADRVGDPNGTTIRQYFENFTGSPNPGGVKPGFGHTGYSPQCAGSFSNWDTGSFWPNDAANAGTPQWNIYPIGGPALDSAGHATGCN